MEPDDRADLERILSEISVLSPTTFLCGGKEIVSSLEEFLYSNCYTVRFRDSAAETTEPETGDLTEELRAAHPGQGARESGWIVEQAFDSGEILARKGRAARRFRPGYYLFMVS